KTAGLEVFRRMLQGLTNEQINYGMKHFLSKMDIDKISKGEHPEFGTVDKLGLFIRGAINRKLAESLKYTSELNQKLVEHYYNYPTSPQLFPQWQVKLNKYLVDAFSRFR
ncbi:MAG: dehydrogenase, partial [Nitrososphaeraceae archaeon]